jgi:hypothetical protein
MRFEFAADAAPGRTRVRRRHRSGKRRVEAHRTGLVAAIPDSAQQVGGGLGLAIFSTIVTSGPI